MEITMTLWRERLLPKRRFWGVTFSQMVSPLLYFMTFGMELGRVMEMDGKPYLYYLIPGFLTMAIMRSSYTSVSTCISAMCLHEKGFKCYLYPSTRMHLLAIEHILTGALRGMYFDVFVVLLGIVSGVRLAADGWLLTAVILNSPIFSVLDFLATMMMEGHCDMNNFADIMVTPTSPLCGTFFSLDGIPGALKWMVDIMSLTHATHPIWEAFFGGGVSRLSMAVAVLFATALTGGCVWACYREAKT